MQPWKLVRLLHPRDATAAFAALQHHSTFLYAPSSPPTALARFVHHRCSDDGYRRDHLELPLQHLLVNSDVYRLLPPEVRHVCVKLHEAALQHVQEALRDPSVDARARAEVTHNLGKKSVLRILRYPAGSGCRPHVDPGLCTALLTGSAGGLEVNTRDVLPVSFTNRPGDYTSRQRRDVAEGVAAGSDGNVLDVLPHWEPVVSSSPGDVLLMCGNMMGVLSGGALPGVLHRVRRDWGHSDVGQTVPASPAEAVVRDSAGASPLPPCAGEGSGGAAVCRFNIIVELRPAQAKRWYGATRADEGVDRRHSQKEVR